MKKISFVLPLFAALILAACSSSSGGGTIVPTPTATPTPTPTPPATYTITFNANDGSQSPVTATQTFTAGVSQALKTITELGFKKDGFNFAGWLSSPDATEAAYADGASYTATGAANLYAKWSAIPVYSVNVSQNERGTVTATPATGIVGTEITLSATPNTGYELASYTVIAADGTTITVTNGKFTMPARNVTVAATFNAVNYTVACGPFTNGNVSATPATAAAGATVTLTISPASGYGLSLLAVTAAGGASVAMNGTGNTRTFTMPAKNVTVTAVFAALPTAASGEYEENGTSIINGKQYDLVTFGLWPQTIKAASVTVNENETETHGDFTYCRGSDGQWYVKQVENACESDSNDRYYSDRTYVNDSSKNSYRWFKVEPIKWRILTTNYGGKKLLLAEKILIAKLYGNTDSNIYQDSQIRKWLNSNVASANVSDYSDSKGFIKTAFTAAQIAQIADMGVDNSMRSTNPDSNAKAFNNGQNQYARSTATTDKVFLLSEQEATTSAYGFDDYGVYSVYDEGNTRIRQNTDFSMASGAYKNRCTDAFARGGYWWLRSPYYFNSYYVCRVDASGFAGGMGTNFSGIERCYTYCGVGVVPALCLNN